MFANLELLLSNVNGTYVILLVIVCSLIYNILLYLSGKTVNVYIEEIESVDDYFYITTIKSNIGENIKTKQVYVCSSKIAMKLQIDNEYKVYVVSFAEGNLFTGGNLFTYPTILEVIKCTKKKLIEPTRKSARLARSECTLK